MLTQNGRLHFYMVDGATSGSPASQSAVAECGNGFCNSDETAINCPYGCLNYNNAMSFYGGDFYTISDETSELVCGAGTNNANNAHVIQALRCEGPYCDNVSVRCVAGSQGASRASVTWSGWFGAGQSAECADGEFVQGFDCSGSHCSEMRIACAPFGEWNIEHCAWTNTGFSEEESDLDHPDADTYDDNEEYSETWNDAAYFGHDGYSDGRGYFLAGIRCDGSRCDEKKFKVCRPPLPVADD